MRTPLAYAIFLACSAASHESYYVSGLFYDPESRGSSGPVMSNQRDM
jgi:hypothetical protein